MSPQQPQAPAPRRGGRPPKLTPAQVLAIREAAAEGEPHGRIAERYGVSRTLVSMITRGVRWPEVGGPITYRYKPLD